MSETTLWCLVINDARVAVGNTFKVKVSLTDDIDDLAQKIIAERKALAQWEAADLYLWKPTNDLADDSHLLETVGAWQLNRETREGHKMATFLSPSSIIGEEFGGKLPTRCVHVLVQVPLDKALSQHQAGKRKRADSDDASRIVERWRSKRAKSVLPTIAELASVADEPLAEAEKIPISIDRMEGLVSSIDIQDVCTSDDVKLLFRAGEGNSPLDEVFFAVAKAPPAGGTEESFHSFWDKNVRDILELLIPSGRSTRNSSRHTATEKLRPDYAFLLNNLCPFRGEEKASDNTDDPRKELAEKLAWAYAPAPYILGYYARGADLTIVAISPPPPGQTLPVVHDIASANLRLRKDRIKNIRRLINLAALFQTLANLVRPSDAEFEVLQRDNGTVEIAGHCIIKTYTGLDKLDRILRLRNVYALLQEKHVPHVDSLVHHFQTAIVVSPRGLAAPPQTEEELLAALICVLEVLVVLHKHPPIFHRDIRWPNVMRSLGVPQDWFIIDWEDAACPPTVAQSHFSRRNHSPQVFADGHGVEVDIWSVGELIIECEALGVSSELQKLGRWMQDPKPPSAKEALEKITEYQSSRF